MRTNEFLQLSTKDMQIEILESDAWNFACKAQNEFTLSGNTDTYRMYEKLSFDKLTEIKKL